MLPHCTLLSLLTVFTVRTISKIIDVSRRLSLTLTEIGLDIYSYAGTFLTILAWQFVQSRPSSKLHQLCCEKIIDVCF